MLAGAQGIRSGMNLGIPFEGNHQSPVGWLEGHLWAWASPLTFLSSPRFSTARVAHLALHGAGPQRPQPRAQLLPLNELGVRRLVREDGSDHRASEEIRGGGPKKERKKRGRKNKNGRNCANLEGKTLPWASGKSPPALLPEGSETRCPRRHGTPPRWLAEGASQRARTSPGCQK